MSTSIDSIVSEYRKTIELYQAFASRLEALIIDLLASTNVKLHFSESRVKSPESLKDKLTRPGKSYDAPLKQVPDLVGIRIVLYYRDNIPTVGEIIKREFEIIEEVSSHQPDKYSPDQFGYISMHYIVKINSERIKLIEWKSFADIHAEIQVRTLLQHSWAAVSHALQYKREGDVPITLRRRLYRLAGLFELADEEFIAIRDARDSAVLQSVEAVRDKNKSARIDSTVIIEVMRTSDNFRKQVNAMEKIGFSFESSLEYVGTIVEECERLEIVTLRQLEKIISQDYSAYFRDIFDNNWRVDDSFALYLLLIASHRDSFTEEHLVQRGWSPDVAELVIQGRRKIG
jgi:putative GTP pyrophosphokinase